MSRPYRPSNSTEGYGFMAEFCDHCVRGAGGDCRIQAATMAHGVDDPAYPKEWIEDAQGARCTAFHPFGEPETTERCTRTVDMFGGHGVANR